MIHRNSRACIKGGETACTTQAHWNEWWHVSHWLSKCIPFLNHKPWKQAEKPICTIPLALPRPDPHALCTLEAGSIELTIRLNRTVAHPVINVHCVHILFRPSDDACAIAEAKSQTIHYTSKQMSHSHCHMSGSAAAVTSVWSNVRMSTRTCSTCLCVCLSVSLSTAIEAPRQPMLDTRTTRA